MDDILERIGRHEGPGGLALIALCSAIEYVVPPFPGDAISLFAAFLVSARGWSLPLVFLAMTGGSMAGASCHWALGGWLARRRWELKGERRRKIKHGIDAVARGFERHGAVYLSINRFVPAMRAFFFLTAGYVGMPYLKMLLWGGGSAVVWNAGIMALGFVAGRNREKLEELVRRYATLGYAVVGVVALVFLVRWWWRRRRIGEV